MMYSYIDEWISLDINDLPTGQSIYDESSEISLYIPSKSIRQ